MPAARDSRILITGARAPAALELARILASAGAAVWTADSLRWPLGRYSALTRGHFRVPSPRFESAAFGEAVRTIAAREELTLILPTCEEVFHLAEVRPALTGGFWDGATRLLELHDKGRFAELVASLGLRGPETRRIRGPADLAIPGEWVLKPAFSRFGVEALLPPYSARSLARVAAEVHSGRAWIAQRFLAGRAFCTYSVAWRGRLNAHACYPVAARAGGASITWQAIEHPAIRTWVETFLRATEFHGQIAFDFIENAVGVPEAIECNPRATSGAHLWAGRSDLADAFLGPLDEALVPSAGARAATKIPLLLQGWRGVRECGGLAAWRGWMRGAKDAISRPDDPRPALAQGAALAELAAIALRHGLSLPAASTHDLAWNDRPPL